MDWSHIKKCGWRNAKGRPGILKETGREEDRKIAEDQ